MWHPSGLAAMSCHKVSLTTASPHTRPLSTGRSFYENAPSRTPGLRGVPRQQPSDHVSGLDCSSVTNIYPLVMPKPGWLREREHPATSTTLLGHILRQ